MLKILSPMALALALSFTPATADGPRIGPNGGQLRDAGGKHLELVAQARSIRLFVTDGQHEPIPTTGMRGRAVVLEGKERANVPLEPAGSNVLRGTIDFPLRTEMKAVVVVTLPSGDTIQARFSR